MYFYVFMRKILVYNWFYIKWIIYYFFFKKICVWYVLFYFKLKYIGKCLLFDYILVWCNIMFDVNCWWWYMYIGCKMFILFMWSLILII